MEICIGKDESGFHISLKNELGIKIKNLENLTFEELTATLNYFRQIYFKEIN